jgi:CxxC-x17-CxxC domain-containing protein
MVYKKEGKFGRSKPAGPSRASRFKSGPSYGKRDSPRSIEKPFRGSDERPRARGNFELFDATCESCGKDCQLPFKPTNGKPVYCRDCFNGEKGSSRNDRGGAKPSGDLDEINRKLDKIMRALRID